MSQKALFDCRLVSSILAGVCVCVRIVTACVMWPARYITKHAIKTSSGAFHLLSFPRLVQPCMCVCSICVYLGVRVSMCADGLNIKSLVKAPGGAAESQSQSSNLMRDSVSLSAVVTSPSSSSSLSSACRDSWMCGRGCEVGAWVRAHPRGMTRVTLRSAPPSGSQLFNCTFRHFRAVRPLSGALRRVWEEMPARWNKSAYRKRR